MLLRRYGKSSSYRDIYTVKVEVFMPTERGEPVHCSGFLPLDIDIPRCDGKRVSQSSLSLASRTDGNAVTSPTSRGNPPVQTPPIPSKRHAQSLQPEAYVTFYFRYRPQEILPTQRILRSQSCTSHKRTRSPSPYTRSGVSPTPPFKRSRSYPCSVAGSETTQNVDPLTIPYLARLEARKSRSGAGACGRDLSDKDVIMKRAERSISSMPLRDEVFHGVAVQTESEGCRHCSDDYSDVDVDDDDLLIRVEQQLLETHKMLLQLRTNQKKRRRHTTTRAI
ncbi:hypothetical protein EW145_g1968 [Phellinidium pouzarii]|uniref:Uncharacterized protein n=1 Tax=Phellinidium pouzarii TaxID=167371 RepID=A0A4S4LCJ9_9AGAM|nr:hypothetical protein EW145_g1968 [Phellinidium pouzarii]